MAAVCSEQGRHDQAEPLYLQALAVFQHLLETYPEY